MTEESADRYALLAAGAVILVLTIAGFWLSYAHLAEVAARHGLARSPERQWAWPATLDAFIVAGELLMLRAGLRRVTDWWAIGLTVTGSTGSIALNVAGVAGTTTGPVPVLDYVVAAVPPTGAMLAFGVLMRQIHQRVAHPTRTQGLAGPDGTRTAPLNPDRTEPGRRPAPDRTAAPDPDHGEPGPEGTRTASDTPDGTEPGPARTMANPDGTEPEANPDTDGDGPVHRTRTEPERAVKTGRTAPPNPDGNPDRNEPGRPAEPGRTAAPNPDGTGPAPTRTAAGIPDGGEPGPRPGAGRTAASNPDRDEPGRERETGRTRTGPRPRTVRAKVAAGRQRRSGPVRLSEDEAVARLLPHVPAVLEEDGNAQLTRDQLRRIMRAQDIPLGNDHLGPVLKRLRAELTPPAPFEGAPR